MNPFKSRSGRMDFRGLRNRLLGFLGLGAAAAALMPTPALIPQTVEIYRPVDWPRRSKHRGHNTTPEGQARRRKRHIREESKRRNWRTA